MLHLQSKIEQVNYNNEKKLILTIFFLFFSSRFTDSGKYENSFESCFRLNSSRSGDICNACVLIVKRWRNLPEDTQKNWAHVVNSRSGPGNKISSLKVKKTEEASQIVEKFEKIRRKKKSNFVFKKPQVPSTQESPSDVPGFINVFYWKRYRNN